jgi:hypothetical protein
LYYQINTFPIRKDDAILRVFRDAKVAIGTQSGLMFFANACMGEDPIVCHSGLILEKDQ